MSNDTVYITGPNDSDVQIGRHLMFKNNGGGEWHFIIKERSVSYWDTCYDVFEVNQDGVVQTKTYNLSEHVDMWFIVRHSDIDDSVELLKAVVEKCKQFVGSKLYKDGKALVEGTIRKILEDKENRKKLRSGATILATEVTTKGKFHFVGMSSVSLNYY